MPNINFAEVKGKTRLTVTDENGAVHTSDHDDLKAAQKLANRGLKDGWEAVTPESLAAETKANAAKEKARVEKGKADAEPEPPAPTKGQPQPKATK